MNTATTKTENEITFENFRNNTFANFEICSEAEIEMLKNTEPDYIPGHNNIPQYNIIQMIDATYWYIDGYIYRYSRYNAPETIIGTWLLEYKPFNQSGYSKCKLSDFIKIHKYKLEVGKSYKILYAKKDSNRKTIIKIYYDKLRKATFFNYVFDNLKIPSFALITAIEVNENV